MEIQITEFDVILFPPLLGTLCIKQCRLLSINFYKSIKLKMVAQTNVADISLYKKGILMM